MKLITIVLCLLISLRGHAEPYHLLAEPYPPYEYQKNGKTSGMDIEILDLITKKTGITFKIEFLPWRRAIEMMKNGEADGIFSLLRNKERELFIEFPTIPLYVGDNVIFTMRGNNYQITKIEDLYGKSVGVVYGNSYGEHFDLNDKITKDYVFDQETLIKKLLGHRNEFIVMQELIGHHFIKSMKLKKVISLPFVISKEPYYVGVSKKSPRRKKLIEDITKGLMLIEKSGEADIIRKKYHAN